MRKVVVFGVFDLLHPGHLYFLEQARRHGEHLMVVVTRDARVMHEKKHKPIFNERERLKMILALKIVDRAVLGDKVGEWKILKKLKPHVVCVGYDQNVEWIERCGLKKIPHIVRVKGHKSAVYRSGKLRGTL